MFIDVLLAISTLFAVYYFCCLKRNLPPEILKYLLEVESFTSLDISPVFRLPIVGHLPFLGSNPGRTLLQWSKIYGPTVYVRFGSFGAMVLHDRQQIRRAFNVNAFMGRPNIKIYDTISANRRGIALSDGPKSTEQRKFMQRILRDFGYGKHSMETRILDHIPTLLKVFQDHLSKPFNVKHAFNINILTVIWTIVAGAAWDKNHTEYQLQQLAVNVSRTLKMSTVAEKLSVFLEFIPSWFPEMSGFKEKLRGMAEVQKYLDTLIDEHQRTRSTDNPRDIIDAYLDEIEKTTDPNSSFFASYKCITPTLQEIFMAGVETTTTTLEWLIFYLAKHADVQEKLQKHIDMILGARNLPSSEYRQKLPYVEAVIEEVHRKSSIAPLALFHSAMEDTDFNEFTIPKGTMVIANLYAVHHDKNIWADPEVFRPERFIDIDGKFMKSENVMAFSCGKRSCIGEQLARLQLFLNTVSIFQRFNIKPVGNLPSEDGIFGLTVTVHPFQVLVSKRELN